MRIETLVRRAVSRVSRLVSGGNPDVEEARFYDDAYSGSQEYAKYYAESSYYFVWTVIVDRVRRSGLRRILEIGCGAGQLAEFLLEQGVSEYVGLDFSQVAIDMARQRLPASAKLICEDARTSRLYATEVYDAIICTEVLEHIDADLEVIEKWPTGVRCICTVPNFPYKSHVRHFDRASDVLDRYGRYFECLDVAVFKRPDKPEKVYYICDGTRS